MTDQNQTTKPNFMLTILVDLSHPAFADRVVGGSAQLNLLNVLGGALEAVLVGSEATLAQDREGRAVMTFNIVADETGEGKSAFDAVAEGTRKLQALERARAEQQEGRQAAPASAEG
jgi:hypothetical protein